MQSKDFDMAKFIEFVADLVSKFDIFYEREVDAKYYFLHGGCYELYKVAKYYFPTCECAIRRDYKHCAIIYNDEIFDVTGKILEVDQYKIADTEDIRYMENSFGLRIAELEEENIRNELEKCRVKGILYE